MHLVQMKAAAGRAGNGEVANMCGIEGAAEKTDPAAQPVVMQSCFVQLGCFDTRPALRAEIPTAACASSVVRSSAARIS